MPAITDTPASPPDIHEGCLLCGKANPWSLKLVFTEMPDGGMEADFSPHRRLQGYDGILHGGVISALLDAAMTHVLFQKDITAVTADLHVRFLEPVECRGSLKVRASLVSMRGAFSHLRAELDQDGRIKTRAEGKFLKRKPASAFAEG